MSAPSPRPTEPDLIGALERVTGRPYVPSPPDTRSSEELDAEDRMVEQHILNNLP